MNGKCPKCDVLVTRLRIDGADGEVPGGKTFRMLTYSCPFCSSVLGAQIDPVAVKTDTVNEVLERIQKGR